MENIKSKIAQEIRLFFKLKETKQSWHIPLLAGISVGTPLLVGLYFDQLQSGLTASLAGLLILYLPISASIANRMMTILICAFGFMFSYAIGLCFSFNPIISAIVLGVYAMSVHWISLYFKTRPPGSFFFIMIATMSSCTPHDWQTIPEKIGLMSLGTMFVCSLALLYSLLMSPKSTNPISATLQKNKYADFVEAFITGLFMCLGLLLGRALKLQNPYWIPISCAAVMRGASLYHIWQRVFHRIVGTFVGLGICWILLSISKMPLNICISIMILQFIIEMLIARHYALAVIFITPLTIFLAEAANPLIQNPNMLIYSRLFDISLGSLMGALSGFLIHHEKVRYHTTRRIRKIQIAIKRR